MTKTYELMVLARPDFDASDTKKATELLKKLVGEKVTVKDVKNLGKKELSYPIQKQKEAQFLLATVTGDAIMVGDLEKRAKLGGDIIRFLLTVKPAAAKA